jgi:hypothetical protein
VELAHLLAHFGDERLGPSPAAWTGRNTNTLVNGP